MFATDHAPFLFLDQVKHLVVTYDVAVTWKEVWRRYFTFLRLAQTVGGTTTERGVTNDHDGKL